MQSSVAKISSLVSDGAALRKPLRVLCLHGFRTSAAFLQQQLFDKWDNYLLHDVLDLNFLDAPFPCRGRSDIDGRFAPPFYEWFQYNIFFTEFVGLEECIHYISNYMCKHGPFDGLLGFSQGAVLCAALAGLQEKGLALVEHPPLQFVVVISGAMFKDVKLKKDCYSDIVLCPSIHFIGSKDWLRPKNEELREAFKDPVIIRHGAKHTIPRLDEEATRLLRSFFETFQRCKVPRLEESIDTMQVDFKHIFGVKHCLEGTKKLTEPKQNKESVETIQVDFKHIFGVKHCLEGTEKLTESRQNNFESIAPHEDHLSDIQVAA